MDTHVISGSASASASVLALATGNCGHFGALATRLTAGITMMLICKGAVEEIIAACTHVRDGELSKDGLRVMAGDLKRHALTLAYVGWQSVALAARLSASQLQKSHCAVRATGCRPGPKEGLPQGLPG